ncbi:MAG: hypothetical protein NT167_11195 [Verrucomicrobia bacterium]|nr:hypothetical protein [Verrucomicrobiota bacterium]
MNNQKKTSIELAVQTGRLATLAGLLMAMALVPTALASENVPHRPFAYWANVPDQGQFIAGFVYEQSEAYHMWAGGQYHNVTAHAGGESYGTDINQGYLALQYGLTERWALDFNAGYTSEGWRYFDNGDIQSTSGLMDWSFGVRYQIYNELTETNLPWAPTLTFRAGAVMPGTYSQSFAFAPGLRTTAIEPELLLRKHFGWPGLGLYGDGLFRYNMTTGNNQYIVAAGLFQEIKGWEIDFGYKHLQTLSGTGITYPVDPASNNGYNIIYPRDPRENNDAIQFGFSYTTRKSKWRYGFNLTSVVDGNNTDAKLWLGGSIDIPFGGKHGQ